MHHRPIDARAGDKRRPPIAAMAGMRTLYGLMTAARRRHLLGVLALMLLGAAAEMLTVGAVLPLLALAAEPGSALIPPYVINLLSFAGGRPVAGAAILLAVAVLTATAIRLLLLRTTLSLVTKLGHEIASAIFARMLHQPYAAYVRRNSSEILSAMEKAQLLVFGFVQPALQASAGAVMALFLALLLLAIDPVAAGIGVASILATYALLTRATRHTLWENSRGAAKAMTMRTKLVQESLGAIRDIILDQSQPIFEKRFRAIDRRHRRAVAANAFIASSPRLLVEAAGIIAVVLIVLIQVRRPGGMAEVIPVLGALALGAQRLLPLVQQAWHGWSIASGNAQALVDVAALIESTAAPAPAKHAEPLPFRQSIELGSVSFRYEEDREWVLQGLRLRIGRGERVGITGPSGSGKSTLLDLTMGLLVPTEGEIHIDGERLDGELSRRWQANVAHVPQSVYLIDDSIAANIALADGAVLDMARLRQAATAACLDELVAGLPQGLETPVGERGIRLSGGQRQRIGIARALYGGATLLVLDEATNALDEATEAAILRSIFALAERTIIIATHRAATLAACNKIIRLEARALAAPQETDPEPATAQPAALMRSAQRREMQKRPA
jgi:ABC-type multidrug transport system fused ATPase/permease subunit